MEFAELAAEQIAVWHGLHAPNDAARRLASDIRSVIAAYEAVRGRLRFEDEPASFEAALQAAREPGA